MVKIVYPQKLNPSKFSHYTAYIHYIHYAYKYHYVYTHGHATIIYDKIFAN